ncbi:hypothetical protein K3217_14015 [bacterium BD-1]|nr:hypothetical protein [Ottowia caeni]
MSSRLKMVALTVALSAGNAVCAQDLMNGEFELGPANWEWKQAVTAGIGACDSLATFSANFVNTPQFKIGSDRAARVTAAGSSGSYHSCGQIEQTVFVPIGARLKFDLRIGDPEYTYTSGPGRLSAYARDVQLGVEKTLFSASGSNCNANSPSCAPVGVPRDVDISKFWGRSARLKFQGSTSGQVGGVGYDQAPTLAYIDSVRFELPVLSQAKPKAGGYYNPSRSGQGLHISKAPDGQYSLIWYTFLPNGEPVWYMSDIAFHVGGVWQAPLYKFTWNTATNSRNPGTQIGDVRLESLSATKLNFMWDFYSDGDSSGFDGGEPLQFLTGGQGYTGMWYEPSLPGWGFSVDHEVGSSTSLTVFYYDGTEPVWAYASGQADPEGGVSFPIFRYTSTGLCPQCMFEPVSRVSTPVGELGLRLESDSGWFLGEGNLSDWTRGSSAFPVALSRLTFP